VLTISDVCFWNLLAYDSAGVENEGGRLELHGLGGVAPTHPDLQRQGGHGVALLTWEHNKIMVRPGAWGA
jgi:hypothetical protein